MEAAALATPLAERLGQPAPAITPEAVPMAEARLKRWRGGPAFTDPARWTDRLASDELTEFTLLALLAESAESLERRIGTPAWATRLTALDWSASHGGSDTPLARPAAPLLRAADQRIRSALIRILDGTSAFDLDRLASQLSVTLRRSVHGMLSRTLTLELHLARLRGEPAGDTPQERFASFLATLDDPARRRRLFADYPVLGRQLTLAADQQVETGELLAQRIVSDRELIAETFAGGTDPGAVTDVVPAQGDRHCNGAGVARVTWSNGLVLMYKPRSVRTDAHLGGLLQWLNAAGVRYPFRSARALDRGSYGWTEFIRYEPCADEAARKRFYHRQGGLLALLELLRSNDIHSENLIAAGDQPVLIDLETLFQPGLHRHPPLGTPAEADAAEAVRDSVLAIGLLPTMSWQNKAGGVDLSGLGGQPGQVSNVAVPVLAEAGTDTMRVRLKHPVIATPDHRPVPQDEPLDLLDYADDLAAGFAEVQQLCVRRRDELLAPGGPLQAFEGDSIRFLVRSTIVYHKVLDTGFHPDLLREALERERHFDYLWRDAATSLERGALPAERRDLWRNDIPYFSTRTTSRKLYDSDGQEVPGVDLEPGMAMVRRRLQTWDGVHLASRIWMIRGSLAASALNQHGPVPRRGTTPRQPPTRDDLLTAATAIGDRLAGDAFDRDGSAQWLGLRSQAGRHWHFGPLTADLYDGLAGVALFLAELGRLTGQGRHLELARRTLATVRHQLDRGLLSGGGLAGVHGVAYALRRVAPLLNDESLIDTATAIVRGVPDEPAPIIRHGAVAAIDEHLLAGRPEEAARRAGELLAAGDTCPIPLGVPTPSLAHGLSGTGYALLRAAAPAQLASLLW